MAQHGTRSLITAVLVVAACSLLGGVYGRGIETSAAAASEDDVQTTLKNFTKVYSMVEQNAAEKVNADRAIYNGAIPGMLRTLDPHSNFLDPKAFQLLREDQKGHYYGVGMMVAERNGKTLVIAPFTGSPAYKAGLRPGDVILSVNDKSTENMTVAQVADLLKGPRGTPVKVVAAREGVDKPLTFNLVRDEIPRKSVQDAFWLQPGIAYLDIESFNENTSHEVEDNLARLGENNLKGLVLDLRDNPGGLLNEGVAVADRFLRKNQLIVAHRGRSSPEKPYIARHGNGGRDYPIVVLVNRYSASAAEIVAGAMQDHDRAWVLGENTFGKGLVQTVYPLNENTGLALTTAKYYTPSGRLIQRDYSNISFLDYYNRKDTALQNPTDVKMTDGGRTVYGGGGITPDEKYSAAKLNRFQIDVLRKQSFFNFTARFFAGRDAKLPNGWAPDQNVENDFHQFLLKEGVQFSEAEYAENHAWLKQQLKREIYITAFSVDDARRLAIETDPVMAKAIEAMPKAKALVESAKKLIVQRTQTSER